MLKLALGGTRVHRVEWGGWE